MSQSSPAQIQNSTGKTNTSLSLQTRLVLFVLFISLVPLILIATRDSFQTQQALTNGAELSLKSGATQTANNLDNFIQNTLDSVGIEAQLAEFMNYLTMSPAARTGFDTRDRAKSLVVNLSKKNSHIISYALVDITGNMVLDSSTDAEFNEAKDTYFTQVQFADKPILTAVTYADDKTPIITFASNVMDANGTKMGVLRVKFKASVLQDVIIQSVGPSVDTSVILLDPLRIRMADSQNPGLILKSLIPLTQADYLIAVDTHRFLDIPREDQATNLVGFDLALNNAVNQPFFRADTSPNSPGDDTIAVAFLKTQPWTLVYSRPTSIFLAEVQKQIRINIILVLSAAIIISIGATIIARSLTNPIVRMAKVANSISQGDLNARTTVTSSDEIGVLGTAFNSMTDQLQSTLYGLEQRIDERTAELRKSALKLETIADVGREISVIRDIDTLFNVSVDLIRNRFAYYHVGIFLVDERGEYAILRAASSTAAEKMLAENYKIRVGPAGMVGTVTQVGQANIAHESDLNSARMENPLLPETRSEIVLPLRSHNFTIGALDIQSSTSAAFDDKDIQTFQILADQLAVAIENAQLTQQVEGNLKALIATNQLQTQKIWQIANTQRERPAFEYDGTQVRAVPQNLPSSLLKQLEMGNPIVLDEDTDIQDGHKHINTLLIPLLVLNQVIGVIGLEQEDPNYVWKDEDIALAQAAANRAALTLDNARLLEESQRRAIKERNILESTTRIGTALNIENILQTTVEEVEKILGDSEIILQINTGSQSSKNERTYSE